MGVIQVHQKEVQVKDLGWKMLVDRLDGFPAVLEALVIHLEMTALLLESVEQRTFETQHIYLGCDHILAAVVHDLEILAWCYWLVAN